MTEEDRETLHIILDGVFDKYRSALLHAGDPIRHPMSANGRTAIQDAQTIIRYARKEMNDNIANAVDVVLGWKLDDRTCRSIDNLIRGYYGMTSYDIEAVIEAIERGEARKDAVPPEK